MSVGAHILVPHPGVIGHTAGRIYVIIFYPDIFSENAVGAEIVFLALDGHKRIFDHPAVLLIEIVGFPLYLGLACEHHALTVKSVVVGSDLYPAAAVYLSLLGSKVSFPAGRNPSGCKNFSLRRYIVLVLPYRQPSFVDFSVLFITVGCLSLFYKSHLFGRDPFTGKLFPFVIVPGIGAPCLFPCGIRPDRRPHKKCQK